MRVYLVGTPESVFTVSFLLKPIRRVFTQEDIVRNLEQTEHLKLFLSFDHAVNYARSLRICRASHVVDPSRKKIAPVVHVDLEENSTFYQKNNTSFSQESTTVTYKKYESLHHNFPQKDTQHQDIMIESTVEYKPIPQSELKLLDFKMVAVEFPDIHYPVLNFETVKPGCMIL